MVYDSAKRCVDVAGALLLLGLTSPLLLAAGVALALEDGFPVVFSQIRVGKQGRRFRLYKLRTMAITDLRPEQLGKVDLSNPLVLRVGRVLRRTKIDELPQLINVLRGDMSLVGPRPTISSQASAYTSREAGRLDVTPGMTGWAQVSGNTALTWEERILLDLYYVENRSLVFDLRILWRTLSVVIRGERRANHVNNK